MEPSTLIYFELRGRAESIRLFLHATSTPFEDKRVIAAEEWESLRPTLPFARLPVYDLSDDSPEGVAGTRLCESHVILRYLSRMSTATPQEEEVITQLEVAQEFIAESQEDLWRFNWLPKYYDLLEGYASNTLRSRLEKLTGRLHRNASGGSETSFGPGFNYVDCLAFCYLDEIDAFFPTLLREFEELAELHTRVASRPEVAKYLNSDARPAVFGMGAMGPKVDARIEFEPDAVFECPWSDPIDLAPLIAGQRRY